MFLGVDEAGRGPALGPMVVAGIVASDQEKLHDLGVRDSKMLTNMKRDALFSNLIGEHFHCILVIPAATIDLSRESMTMNQLEVICFASVVASLHRGETAAHPSIRGDVRISLGGRASEFKNVILDAADVNEERFGDEVIEEAHRIEDVGGIGFLSKHKADRDYPVVGAASILAKVTRDRRIMEISESIGENIGSGYPSDPKTISFLKGYIEKNDGLPSFARRSWETCIRLLSKKGQRTLMDF